MKTALTLLLSLLLTACDPSDPTCIMDNSCKGDQDKPTEQVVCTRTVDIDNNISCF